MHDSQSHLRGWIILAVLAVVFGGSAWEIHKAWSAHNRADQAELEEKRQRAIKKVQGSYFGSDDIRTTAASQFLGSQADVKLCDWSGIPLWHGSSSNPNWWSSSKNSDGFEIIAECEADHGKDSDDLSFRYDWSDDWGVTSISWNYTPDYSDER
jgi:hypothetical protein